MKGIVFFLFLVYNVNNGGGSVNKNNQLLHEKLLLFISSILFLNTMNKGAKL